MGVALTRKVEVVTVAAPARQQARVFAAAQRLAEALPGGMAAGAEEGQRAWPSALIWRSAGSSSSLIKRMLARAGATGMPLQCVRKKR